MDDITIKKYGAELYRALKEQQTVTPLTDREPAVNGVRAKEVTRVLDHVYNNE